MKLNLMWARPGVQRTDKSQNKMLKLEPEIILKKQIPWQKISLFRKNHLQKKEFKWIFYTIMHGFYVFYNGKFFKLKEFNSVIPNVRISKKKEVNRIELLKNPWLQTGEVPTTYLDQLDQISTPLNFPFLFFKKKTRINTIQF